MQPAIQSVLPGCTWMHMDAQFGSPEYAREELRAELVSSMMQGVIGLPPGPTMIAQHSAYLASWLQALKNDKNEIFRAAADAQKICDYVSKLAVEAQPFMVSEVADAAQPKPVVSSRINRSPT